MTIEEKIEMYKGKKAFVDNISKAFEASQSSSVIRIEYEVYYKEMQGEPVFQEFLVVTLDNYTKSVRNANGNSNTANLREISVLADGGYYDELDYYDSIVNNGFSLVVFN